MRGIVRCGGYVPFRRLDRASIREVMGSGGGKGTRAVAGFDEDTTTLGVEAGRIALAGGGTPSAVWFATATPAYLDKTNAAAIHAALRLPSSAPAIDMGGAIRSGIGALRAALEGSGDVLVVASDIRTGLPTSADESTTGDGAAALLVGEDGVLAEYLGGASVTREFLDRWRTPGETRSKSWEDRFGESVYVPLGEQAWTNALKAAGLAAGDVGRVIVTGMHARAVGRLRKPLGVDEAAFADDLTATVGNTATAHPLLLLTGEIESAAPGTVIAVVSLADGADVLLFRRTDAAVTSSRTVAAQVAGGAPITYARFLSWRGNITPEPPNRPEPARVSAPAAERADDWKFGFEPFASATGTIATFTVDRLAYSPSPPIVFAIVDFSEGGRFPMELTDVDADTLTVGDPVEPTFRRLSSADGIHNYFWKCRPLQ